MRPIETAAGSGWPTLREFAAWVTDPLKTVNRAALQKTRIRLFKRRVSLRDGPPRCP